MDTKEHEGEKLLHGELVYSVVGGAIEVLREVRHGLHEHPYENALVVELGLRNIRCEQQRRFPVHFKEVQVSEFVPDLIVDNAVVVEAKAVERITDHERGQMLNTSGSRSCASVCSLIFESPNSSGSGSCSDHSCPSYLFVVLAS